MRNNTKYTGERVKELREAKGWSIEKLSDASGVGRAFLKRLEDGKRPNISTSLVNDIARALGTELANLYHTDGPERGQVDIKSILIDPELLVTYGDVSLNSETRETLVHVIEEAIGK